MRFALCLLLKCCGRTARKGPLVHLNAGPPVIFIFYPISMQSKRFSQKMENGNGLKAFEEFVSLINQSNVTIGPSDRLSIIVDGAGNTDIRRANVDEMLPSNTLTPLVRKFVSTQRDGQRRLLSLVANFGAQLLSTRLSRNELLARLKNPMFKATLESATQDAAVSLGQRALHEQLPGACQCIFGPGYSPTLTTVLCELVCEYFKETQNDPRKFFPGIIVTARALVQSSAICKNKVQISVSRRLGSLKATTGKQYFTTVFVTGGYGVVGDFFADATSSDDESEDENGDTGHGLVVHTSLESMSPSEKAMKVKQFVTNMERSARVHNIDVIFCSGAFPPEFAELSNLGIAFVDAAETDDLEAAARLSRVSLTSLAADGSFDLSTSCIATLSSLHERIGRDGTATFELGFDTTRHSPFVSIQLCSPDEKTLMQLHRHLCAVITELEGTTSCIPGGCALPLALSKVLKEKDVSVCPLTKVICECFADALFSTAKSYGLSKQQTVKLLEPANGHSGVFFDSVSGSVSVVAVDELMTRGVVDSLDCWEKIIEHGVRLTVAMLRVDC